MQVLGSLEYAEGATLKARYQTVSEMIFKDLEGNHFQFKWRTIQTWWDRYRKPDLSKQRFVKTVEPCAKSVQKTC